MTEKIRDVLIIGAIAVAIFAAGYFTGGQMLLNTNTTIIGKTLEYHSPGYTDDTPKPAPAKKLQPIKKDSSDYWRRINDSLQAIISGRDTTVSADSARAEYIEPYEITIEDSLTINKVKIFPLNPMESRALLLSTYYKPVNIKLNYLDTTINITRGNNLQTYATVGGCALIGATLGNIPGAGIGAMAGLLIDELF